MSAMIGKGDPFVISIMAWAASFVGTATLTIRQLASLRRAISSSVALTSRVSDLHIDWTTISAAPPTTTLAAGTGPPLRRAATLRVLLYATRPHRNTFVPSTFYEARRPRRART